MDIAGFFDLPPHPDAAAAQDPFDPDQAKTWLDALDTLLWRWKSPLQREWYPFLMGLRGDLLYRSGAMDSLRKEKPSRHCSDHNISRSAEMTPIFDGHNDILLRLWLAGDSRVSVSSAVIPKHISTGRGAGRRVCRRVFCHVHAFTRQNPAEHNSH